MDHLLGVNPTSKKSRRQASRKTKKAVKVVYISSPMKVSTSASKFRALVQELTGRHSDTARLMEMMINGGGDHKSGLMTAVDYDYDYDYVDDDRMSEVPLGKNYGQLPAACSENSMLVPFDEIVVPRIREESFLGTFPSSFFHESSQLDMFRGLNPL